MEKESANFDQKFSFPALNFTVFGHQNLDLDLHWPKIPDPDPHWIHNTV